eukprot:NODE_505_length_7533_cov_0.471886.p2 type:complete len:421 gc:universal NODE_505_length_7533_cov_0.471886:2136-3398(+)
MSVNALDKGIELAKQATLLDEQQKYAEASTTYTNALEYLMLAIKYEKNEKMKETIRIKVQEYLKRAEQIKDHLNTERTKKGKAVSSQGQEADDFKSNLNSVILQEKPNVKWDDVAGLEAAKESLKEAVILPIRFPHLFTGTRQPWKGILLFGPPGTGKSYLAKAVATEANSTFFAVSSSDLVSKWMGESEKLVKSLFQMARDQRPSIIFIDEIDSLTTSRSDGESEASRRIKTELLVQINGVGVDNNQVLVLGATNIPWSLDPAVRRRFEKRIYIALPDLSARTKMVQIHIGDTPHTLDPSDFQELGQMTDGYSGSDISVVVRDALMMPVRKIQSATHFKQVQAKDRKDINKMKVYWTPCSPGDPNAIEKTWMEVQGDELLEPTLNIQDFYKAVQNNRPTVSKADLVEHEKWAQQFGMDG